MKDMLREVCSDCKCGLYKETSVMDDINGVLHCDECNHQTARWVLGEESCEEAQKEIREINYFELKVKYLDEDGLETTEWVDPILQVNLTKHALEVYNGNYTYAYPWHLIKEWEITPVYSL